MPTREAAAFVMVQSEFPLEVLVGSLGSPALHHPADELLLGPMPWQGNEKEVGRLLFTVPPLDEQPERFLLALGHARGNDSTQGEVRGQILLSAFAPSATAKATPL